jgi:hypothetical protein
VPTFVRISAVPFPDSAVTAFAILVNLSSPDLGLPLTLSLLRNLLRESDFRHRLIRENWFQMLCKQFQDFNSDIVLGILDALVRPSFTDPFSNLTTDPCHTIEQNQPAVSHSIDWHKVTPCRM